MNGQMKSIMRSNAFELFPTNLNPPREALQEALVQLGYLQEHDFVLKHRTFDIDLDPQANRDLNKLVTNSTFKNITSWIRPSGESSVVRVNACREDMPAWNRIISQFDSGGTR